MASWCDKAAVGAALLVAALAGSEARASILTDNSALVFAGTLSSDDDVAFHDFEFAVPRALDVAFESFSYAGGSLRDGTLVPSGGFDPVISLFDGDLRLIGLSDDWLYRADPLTGNPYDGRLDLTLEPGRYRVAVSQYDNLPLAPLGGLLLSGFSRAGSGNFTAGSCGAPAFCDSGGNSRTASYVVEVATLSTIPVPASFGLLLGATGLLATLAVARRPQPSA